MTSHKAHPSRIEKLSEERSIYETRTMRAAPPQRNSILKKCRQILTETYGERLRGVILYGSMARNQPTPSSDVDLLILLTPPIDYFVELRRLVDVLYPIQLESDRLISAKPVDVNDFESGRISLYRNAKREGRAV
jgi:uncharacterized protein